MRVEKLFPSNRVSSLISNNIGQRFLDGSSSDRAAPSAQFIKNLTGTNNDGVYWINLPVVGPKQTYCIMDSAFDGGGWMMTMKATRGTTFQWSSTHWTTITLLNETQTNTNDGDAKFDAFNYAAGTEFMAIFPDISNGGSLPSTTRGWTWLQKNLPTTSMVSFFNRPQLSISSPGSFSGFGSPWSTQNGIQFYGFNFTQNSTWAVRWGFAWNNEADWGSNDVGGGIGMNNGASSAADRIQCCQVQTGINRTARVEMYIR